MNRIRERIVTAPGRRFPSATCRPVARTGERRHLAPLFLLPGRRCHGPIVGERILEPELAALDPNRPAARQLRGSSTGGVRSSGGRPMAFLSGCMGWLHHGPEPSGTDGCNPSACRIRPIPATPIALHLPGSIAPYHHVPYQDLATAELPAMCAARVMIVAVLFGPRLPDGVVRSGGPVPPEDIETDAQRKQNWDGCDKQPSPEHPERQRFIRTHPNLPAVVRGRNPRGVPSPASATSCADHHSWITVRIRIATSGKGRNANTQRSFVSKRRCM